MFRIPLPKPSGEILESGLNTMLQNILAKKQQAAQEQYQKSQLGLAQQRLQLEKELQPLRKTLAQAQAEQASAKAAQTKADTDLLKNYLTQIGFIPGSASSNAATGTGTPSGMGVSGVGGAQPGIPSSGSDMTQSGLEEPAEPQALAPTGQPGVSINQQPTSPNIPQPQPMKVHQAGIEPVKQYMRDAFLSKRLNLGDIKIVDIDGVQTAMSPISGPIPLVKGVSDWEKKLHAEDAKLVGQWGETLTAAHDMQPTLDAIQEIITSPVLAGMKQHPELFGHDMAWFQRFGSKEQQEMVGNLQTYTGELYTNMGQKFKGQFRVGEQALVKELKPDPKDSLGVLVGKSNALQAINQIVTRRISAADKLVRSGKYSPSEALQKADKMVNGKQIRDQVKKHIEDQISEKAEIEVISPDGRTLKGPKKNVQNFLNTHPGWRVNSG